VHTPYFCTMPPLVPVACMYAVRLGMGVNFRGTGYESPRIWSGDANANCPSDLVMFQNFKHQTA